MGLRPGAQSDQDRPATSQTNHAGIFAVGDIVSYTGKLKLILSGFAEAAMAAHAIHPLVHPDQELHWEYSTIKGVPGRAGRYGGVS
jgi:thioredoxin reductase (NADPH)